MPPLRIGIVGCGKIARDQHVPAIAGGGLFELAAVADPHARLEGVPGHATLEAMLAADPAIAAVAMCQPPQFRFDSALAAIGAGKHVLLEKPPGATLGEVEILAEAARARGVTLFTAWHSREGAAVRAARDWLADAAIRSVEIEWKEDVRVWHPGQAWIFAPGGFGVFDPGINALSILTEILPRPVRVTGARLEVPANQGAPIAATIAMRGDTGFAVSAAFDFRQTGPQTWDIRVDTDRGGLVLSDGGNRLAIGGAAVPVAPEHEYPAIYRRFHDCIASGTSEVDVAPVRLVADSFMLGEVSATDPFEP